ncbi:MAG: energy-coupling factor transporter ATPase [Ruminococcus sp.]|nr:energy-coupling factor transporter ATPase [Candidatus Apopatosoma intestinale]
MAETIIKTEKLCFEYEKNEGEEKTQVLRSLDLTVERGSFVAVLGHNGSGKSTLAKVLNLLVTPTSGKVWLFGKEINEETMTEDELYEIRRRVGMVFQNPDNQLVATIVEEDVAFGPENIGVEPSEIRRRVDEALETVGMTAFARHSPHQLSGGQKQRVAIAGILALRPEIIVFDESTAMLDPMGRREVLDTIRKLNRDNGTTILMITHYMDEAIDADRVIVLDDGRIVLDGTPREVFSHVEEVRAAGLDVPQITELTYRLGLSGTPITAEEGADAIEALITNRQERN